MQLDKDMFKPSYLIWDGCDGYDVSVPNEVRHHGIHEYKSFPVYLVGESQDIMELFLEFHSDMEKLDCKVFSDNGYRLYVEPSIKTDLKKLTETIDYWFYE